MVPRSLAQKHDAKISVPVTILFLLLTTCSKSSGGGITIAQSDGTAPTLSLGAGQPGGQNVSVSGGGSGQTMKLTSKTGVLNLLATASDPESGVDTLQIWVNEKTTTCDAAGLCKTIGPGLLGKPTFDSTSPQKKPGDATAASSILAQALDLTKEIPQGSVPGGGTLAVDLIIYARAVNNLNGQTLSPVLTVTWSEP